MSNCETIVFATYFFNREQIIYTPNHTYKYPNSQILKLCATEEDAIHTLIDFFVDKELCRPNGFYLDNTLLELFLPKSEITKCPYIYDGSEKDKLLFKKILKHLCTDEATMTDHFENFGVLQFDDCDFLLGYTQLPLPK